MQLKQLENNKLIAEDYHNMGYKMKGSPAKLGTIQGTSGHKSALETASPAKGWLGNVLSKAKNLVSKAKTAKMSVSGKGEDNVDITKQSRNKTGKKVDLKAARKEGRIARKQEKYDTKIARAGETREQRLERRRARNEKWGDVVDQVFNPAEARKTARLKSQQASEERITKEKTRGAEEVAKTQAASDLEVARRRYTDTERRAKKKTQGPMTPIDWEPSKIEGLKLK